MHNVCGTSWCLYVGLSPSLLVDKNSDWISASVADQIPVSFITKICLLHESSKAELIQRGTVTDISTEEAACLTTLSLIYGQYSTFSYIYTVNVKYKLIMPADINLLCHTFSNGLYYCLEQYIVKGEKKELSK